MSGAATPLRILQIMRAPVGGLFRHVADLTRGLAERGHAVGLVVDSSSGDAQTERKLAALLPAAELGIHRLPMPRVLGTADITTPFKIKALTKSLGVTILHGHGAKGGFGARLAAMGNPSLHAIYTPHGGVLHFDPKSVSGGLFMAIERGLLGSTDAIVFESAYAQRTFAAQVKEPGCRQRVIHNGVAESEFAPMALAPSAIDFVYVGELRMLKGIDLVIEALEPLARSDGAPARLLIAGDGPDRALLASRIEDLGIGHRVQMVGVQPARAMFAQAGCVIVPSRAESLPYIVLEAAAAGRPLIATEVGGIPEIFGPSAKSLVKPGSVDALRSAMGHYLSDPEPFKAEALLRRQDVQARFSMNQMIESIAALYTEAGR